MTKIELQHLTKQDTDKNLVQDLLEFSDAEKKELETIKKATIDTKLEYLNDAIINGMEKEKINAELWAKLLLWQTIDAPTRQLSSKTDDQLIATAIKYIYYTLWADKDRDSSLSKTHGLRGDSSLAQALQRYLNTQSAQQIPVDGKLGNITKQALQQFLQDGPDQVLPEDEKKKANPNELTLSPEIESKISASVDKAMNSYADFLRANYEHMSDGAFCTTYTQMMLGVMMNESGQYRPVRNLWSTWDIDRLSQTEFISPHIAREVLDPTEDPSSLKKKFKTLPAGTLLTLQYDNSNYKLGEQWLNRPTHTLICHGNGKFSHRFGKKVISTNVNAMSFKENGKLTISGSNFTITPANEKYACGIYRPLIKKSWLQQPFQEKNTEKMSGQTFVQQLADNYSLSKELIVHQMHLQGYSLHKKYEAGEITISLAVKPQTIYSSNYETNIDNIVSKLPSHIQTLARDTVQLNNTLWLNMSSEQMAILLTSLENESGKAEGIQRAAIKNTYHSSPRAVRGIIDAKRKPDSFGAFQINKQVISPILRKEIQTMDSTGKRTSLIKNIDKTLPPEQRVHRHKIVQKLRELKIPKNLHRVKQNEKVIAYMEANFWWELEELLLNNLGFSVVCAHNIMKTNRAALTTNLTDPTTGILNMEDLDLTNTLAQNTWLPRAYKTIAQYNLVSLSQKIWLPFPQSSKEEWIPNIWVIAPGVPWGWSKKITKVPFYIDGIRGDRTQQLLHDIRTKLWQNAKDLVFDKENDTITIQWVSYKLISNEDNKKLMTVLSQLAQKQWIVWKASNGLNFEQLKQRETDKLTHLHYAYSHFDKLSERNVPHIYKMQRGRNNKKEKKLLVTSAQEIPYIADEDLTPPANHEALLTPMILSAHIEPRAVKLSGVNIDTNISYTMLAETINKISDPYLRTEAIRVLIQGPLGQRTAALQQLWGMRTYDESVWGHPYPDHELKAQIDQTTLQVLRRPHRSAIPLDKLNTISTVPQDVKTMLDNITSNKEWKYPTDGKSYCIVSKTNACIYMFSPDHKLLSRLPVILGKEKWDTYRGSNNKINTTPPGMYKIASKRKSGTSFGQPGYFSQLEPIWWQYDRPDNNGNGGSIPLLIHPTIDPQIREPLLQWESSPDERRLSEWCINISRVYYDEFFDHVSYDDSDPSHIVSSSIFVTPEPV